MIGNCWLNFSCPVMLSSVLDMQASSSCLIPGQLDLARLFSPSAARSALLWLALPFIPLLLELRATWILLTVVGSPNTLTLVPILCPYHWSLPPALGIYRSPHMDSTFWPQLCLKILDNCIVFYFENETTRDHLCMKVLATCLSKSDE